MNKLIWLLILFPLNLFAQDDLRVRAQFISPQNQLQEPDAVFEAVVGGRVTLAVDILTSRWFAKAPRFSHLIIRDAINLKAETFATNFSERIGVESYAVQRREYTIFPQRAGQFVIDGIEVDAWVPGEQDEPLQKRTLRTKPLLLMVNPLPPVSFDDDVADGVTELRLGSSLVAQDVMLEQSFSSGLDQLSVGDLVERKVEVRAAGTLGMLISPLVWPEARGMKQMSLSSSVDDKTNRGEFVGIRRETRQYTIVDNGELQLPAISLSWWNGQSWQYSELPGLKLSGVQSRNNGWKSLLPNWETMIDQSGAKLILLLGLLIASVVFLLWLLSLMTQRGAAAVRRFGCSYAWLKLSLLWAVWWCSASRVVAAFYRWRNQGPQPLERMSRTDEELWNDWCVMSQEEMPPSVRQRIDLARMIRKVKSHSRTDQNYGLGGDTSMSGTKALQPLNPP